MFSPRFLARHRRQMPGAAVAIGDAAAVLLLGAKYSDKVTPLSPTLPVCYVWLLQMVICCVFSPSAGNRLGKSKNTTSWF
jgi:hypothetical protein